MNNSLRMVLGIGLLMFAGSATAGKVYKWVDSNGKPHYGDRADAKAGQVEEVHISKTPAVGSEITSRQQRTERLLDSYQKEREEKAEVRQAAVGEKKEREAKCAAAMNSQQRYERAGSLYSKDDAGNRTYLSDEDRNQAIADAQAAVDEWCR